MEKQKQNSLIRKTDEAGHVWRQLEICGQCGKKVETMCFRGTGVCSELCRKRRDGEEVTTHVAIGAA